MLYHKDCNIFLYQWLNFYLKFLFNAGVLLSVKVVPNFVTVEENQIAVFDCYYSCEVLKMHSHNAYWHVGDVERYRGFTYRTASLFTRKTGLHVETKDLSTCDENLSGTVRHQLKINASSSARWNATAVQCVALRTHVDQVDFYSHFALMIVTPRKNPVPEAPTTEITDGIEATTTTEVMDLTKTKEEKSTNSKFMSYFN